MRCGESDRLGVGVRRNGQAWKFGASPPFGLAGFERDCADLAYLFAYLARDSMSVDRITMTYMNFVQQ